MNRGGIKILWRFWGGLGAWGYARILTGFGICEISLKWTWHSLLDLEGRFCWFILISGSRWGFRLGIKFKYCLGMLKERNDFERLWFGIEVNLTFTFISKVQTNSMLWEWDFSYSSTIEVVWQSEDTSWVWGLCGKCRHLLGVILILIGLYIGASMRGFVNFSCLLDGLFY